MAVDKGAESALTSVATPVFESTLVFAVSPSSRTKAPACAEIPKS